MEATEVGVIDACVQFLIQHHVRLSHAQHLLSGSHILSSDLKPEGVIKKKVILEYITLKALFGSLYLTNNLRETINIRLQDLFLPLNDRTQGNYSH